MGMLSGALTIHLGAVAQNYCLLDGLSGPSCETGACVKADAYGLGMEHVAPALHRAGARRFFVATLDEAIELRAILPQVHIYVLHGFSNAARMIYNDHNLTPVLNTLAEIEEYAGFTKEKGKHLSAAIHFDTGMNRLGLCQKETEMLYENKTLLDGITLDFIMTHFSSADEKNNPVNQEQYNAFRKISNMFKNTKYSLCNSGGIFLSPDYHMDITRPGIALYGGKPVAENENVMRPTISLKVPVLQLRSVKKGDLIGYNGSHRIEKSAIIATVSVGYADGFLRSLSK